jgi:hypothetical protein
LGLGWHGRSFTTELAPAKVTFSIQFHRLLEGSLQIKGVVALRPTMPHSDKTVYQALAMSGEVCRTGKAGTKDTGGK